MVFDCCPPVCWPGLHNACIDPDHTEGDDTSELTNIEDGEHILMVDMTPALEICYSTISQRLAEAAAKNEPKKTFEEIVPSYQAAI